MHQQNHCRMFQARSSEACPRRAYVAVDKTDNKPVISGSGKYRDEKWSRLRRSESDGNLLLGMKLSLKKWKAPNKAVFTKMDISFSLSHKWSLKVVGDSTAVSHSLQKPSLHPVIDHILQGVALLLTTKVVAPVFQWARHFDIQCFKGVYASLCYGKMRRWL